MKCRILRSLNKPLWHWILWGPILEWYSLFSTKSINFNYINLRHVVRQVLFWYIKFSYHNRRTFEKNIQSLLFLMPLNDQILIFGKKKSYFVALITASKWMLLSILGSLLCMVQFWSLYHLLPAQICMSNIDSFLLPANNVNKNSQFWSQLCDTRCIN